MAKIWDEIQKKIKQIEDEHANTHRPTGDEVGSKAIAAILGGPGEYAAYMNLFTGGDQANLIKLMPEANPSNDQQITKRNRSRAYLLGNGPCGADSPSGVPLDFGVEDVLD